jgi:hypothetical protein
VIETGNIERMDWATFYPMFARAYKVSRDSADHVTILGPTGTGKTTLAMQVAALRKYVVALGTKPKDAPFAGLLNSQGYVIRRSSDAALPSPSITPRVCIWPTHTRNEDADALRHHRVFKSVLSQTYSDGGWHVICEEASHLVDLGLRNSLRRNLRLGRSNSNGLILCAQRPVFIPKEAISGAQHIFMFGTNDKADLDSLGGMNGMSSKVVREAVAGLGRNFDFLYVDTRTGKLVISNYPLPKRK